MLLQVWIKCSSVKITISDNFVGLKCILLKRHQVISIKCIKVGQMDSHILLSQGKIIWIKLPFFPCVPKVLPGVHWGLYLCMWKTDALLPDYCILKKTLLPTIQRSNLTSHMITAVIWMMMPFLRIAKIKAN